MLEILQGNAARMRIEEPRVDGAEFWIERHAGREYWQVKRQLLSQASWTLRALTREGVLAAFHEQLRAGHRCVFASITDGPELRNLAERALDATRAASNHQAGFEEFRTTFLAEKKWQVEFAELRRQWGNASEEDAFCWLSKVEVRSADDYTLSQNLSHMLETRFSGAGMTTLACLRTLYQDSVHQVLTAESLHRHLDACDIRPRTFSIEAANLKALEAVTDAYISGQRSKLIRRQMIPRAVAKDIVAKVEEARFGMEIVITGSAGSGKSGCTLEIVERLVQKGVPVLAFRLDRLEPVQTTTALGLALDLPESPALVLARAFPRQKVVLIVDQLDFISTTSGRHPDFFDTVAALIGEVRGLRSEAEIHLVLVCRQFDFEHDARLRGLLPANESPVVLSELSESDVRAVLVAEGGDAARLTAQQLKLLQTPQNLALFVDSGLVRSAHSNFGSQKELFDAYWHAKRTALITAWPAEAQQWLPIIETLVHEMNDAQEISVPKARMDAFSPHFLDVMVSEGVLTFDKRRYGFGHESFFDYCFARTFANGQRELSDLLETDAQHLFRRAQTRQVLVYLRDDDRTRYLRNVAALLGSDRIRAHVKLLILELVAAFSDTGDDEWAILLPRIESELACIHRGTPNPDKIATRTFEVFRASRALFRVADRLRHIESWLHSGEPPVENEMIWYLRWQTHEHADRVAEVLEPFVERGGEWPQRIYSVMQRDLERSRRLFELFLRLLGNTTLERIEVSHGLAEKEPAWFAEAAASVLDRQITIAVASQAEGPLHVSIENAVDAGELFESARREPAAFLRHMLPSIIRAARATIYPKDEEFSHDTIWVWRYRGDHISTSEAYLASCETAFDILGQQSPEALRPFIPALRDARMQTANSLLLCLYTAGGEEFAEEAMQLLCEQPTRLHCGFSDSLHWISKCLIEKLSSHCLPKTFAALESVLSNYRTEYELSDDGAPIRGRASFTLLSALPRERCSSKTVELLAELKARFVEPDSAPRGIRCYSIVSPISEDVAQPWSDDEWLAAIDRFRGVGHHHDWEHPEISGEQHFAGMMQNFVKREPERFARVALRFPPDVDPSYWMNVLYGLRDAPIPSALLIQVIRRVFDQNDNACLTPAAELLCRVTDSFLPPDAIAFLIRLATEHPDPDREHWRPEREGDAACFNGDVLNCGINTVRGRTAEQLRNLLITDRRYLDVFLPTIERLVHDPNISVRACAVSALFGVGYHDADLAVSLFHTLAETDDAILGTPYAEDFIRRGLSRHMASMRPHIERMLRSERSKVCQAGGRLAALARLTHERQDDLAASALAGNASARLGVAEIAGHNFTHPDCRSWCEQTIAVLFDDPDSAVLEQTGRCFWHLWQKPDRPLTEHASLIANFLKSAAFASHPTFLLHALEDSRHQLPEITLDVCEHFIERCSEQARDSRTRHAGAEYRVGPLVFRAYQQLTGNPAQLRALRLIDRMCEEGLHSAAKNLAEFER